MIAVTVGTSGLGFHSVAEKLSGPLKQKFLEKTAAYAYSLAYMGAPFRTGELKNSLVYGVQGDQAYVAALAPHAVFVSKGTRPHTIRPVRASCLAFEADSGIVHSVRLTRFAKVVYHPGTRANPYMENAAQRTRENVERIFAETWYEMI